MTKRPKLKFEGKHFFLESINVLKYQKRVLGLKGEYVEKENNRFLPFFPFTPGIS